MLGTGRMPPPGLAAVSYFSSASWEPCADETRNGLHLSSTRTEMEILCAWAELVCDTMTLGASERRQCCELIVGACCGDSVETCSRSAKLSYRAFAAVFPFTRQSRWALSAIFGVVSVTGISDEEGAQLLRRVLSLPPQ